MRHELQSMIRSRTLSAIAASCGLVLFGPACEALQMQPAEGGMDPGGAAPGTTGTGSTPGSPPTGPAGAAPSLVGAITPADATRDCPVTVAPPAIGGALRGRVCARVAGYQCHPIAGALVAYHEKDVAPVCLRGRTITAADGRFRIAGIEMAEYAHYALVVMAAGRLQRAVIMGTVTEGREIDIDDLDLAVSAEGAPPSSLHRSTIAGQVCGRDKVGSCIPLAGATVGYRLGADALPKIIAETRADKQGRFALTGVEPAAYAYYRLSVTAKGYDQKSQIVGGADPGSTAVDDVDLVEAAEGVESVDLLSATIAGTVCISNITGCAPVPGAEVALLGEDRTQVLKSARADSKGRFGFPGLTPESRAFTIRCEAPDKSAQGTATVYGLEIGQTESHRMPATEQVTPALTPEARAFTIRCEAPDSSGQGTATIYGLAIAETDRTDCRLPADRNRSFPSPS